MCQMDCDPQLVLGIVVVVLVAVVALAVAVGLPKGSSHLSLFWAVVEH